jgi:hypothetical protein
MSALRGEVDELDAWLDGRLGEVPLGCEELAAVATTLRAEATSPQLDPALAGRHIRRALGRPKHGPASDRRAWRRRLTVGVALALLLAVPAAVASGSSLPGEPLYGVKQLGANVRLLVARSSEARAKARVDLAATRLSELEALVAVGRTRQVPGAVEHLRDAVARAGHALATARADGDDATRITALESRLAAIVARTNAMLTGTVKPSAGVVAATTTRPSPTTTSPALAIVDVVQPAVTAAAPATTGPAGTGAKDPKKDGGKGKAEKDKGKAGEKDKGKPNDEGRKKKKDKKKDKGKGGKGKGKDKGKDEDRGKGKGRRAGDRAGTAR